MQECPSWRLDHTLRLSLRHMLVFVRVVSWLQDWDRARLRNKFRVVHTKAGTDKMNSVNRLIDQHGLKALEADQESQDLILRNNLLWTANGNLRCLTASERERLLGFPA